MRAGDYGGSTDRIARTHLPTGATEQQVAEYSQQIIAANNIDNARRVQAGDMITVPDYVPGQTSEDGRSVRDADIKAGQMLEQNKSVPVSGWMQNAMAYNAWRAQKSASDLDCWIHSLTQNAIVASDETAIPVVNNLTAGDILKSYAAGAGNFAARSLTNLANLFVAMGDINGDAELFPQVQPFKPKSNYFASEGAATAEGLSFVIGATQIGKGLTGLVANSAPRYLTPAEFTELPRTGTIDPKIIRYSQDSAGANFKPPYGSVDDFTTGLRSGDINPSTIDPIRLVERDGNIFTLDNRRLYGFQEADVTIPYQKLDAIPKRELFKFTTTNDGTSMIIRRGK